MGEEAISTTGQPEGTWDESEANPPFAALPRQGRILAIDLGERRIGLAVSDPLGITAQGLPTLERQSQRQVLDDLQELVARYEVSLILVGNPVNMDGTEGSQSAKARAFADDVQRRMGVQVILRDERLTSLEAERVLEESGWQRKQRVDTRRAQVDRMAAVLLLQSFLESRRRGSQPPITEEP